MSADLLFALHVCAAILASWRLTEVIAVDRITEGFRKRFPHYLWGCPRCVSVWAGGACTLAVLYAPWLNWPLAFAWLYLVKWDWVLRAEQAREDRIQTVARQMFLRSNRTISGGSGEAWENIITTPRAVDWSTAGVAGGIPARTSPVCANLTSSASAATISAAFSACAASGGGVVNLAAGTYNLSPMTLSGNNVTLRGASAGTTILNVNGATSAQCHINESQQISFCSGTGNMIGSDPPLDNAGTWNCDDTGGICAQGRTSITLNTVANLRVGSTIWIDQLYEAADGYPVAGDIWVTNWGSGDSFARAGRGMLEGHLVTACGTSVPDAACTSTTITISRGLQMPHFRSSRSPGAYWGNVTTVQHDSGIENVTIDFTAGGNGMYFINCTNCWVKGVRMMRRVVVPFGSANLRMLNVINGMQLSIVDNYFYGYFTQDLVSIYTVSAYTMAQSLIQNNIVHAATNPMVQNAPAFGNVWSYNYVDSDGIDQGFAQSSLILHGVSGQQLIEGNAYRNVSGDNIHSSHHFITLFRNHLSGQAHNASGTETQAGVALYAAQRFFNVIGNVIGNSQWTGYELDCGAVGSGCNTTSAAANQPFIFTSGWMGSNGTGSAATGNDANVKRTLMRWGNWNHVTSTNDNGTNDQTGTRWCAAPLPSNCGLNAGGGGTQIVEVPSTITNYPNAVPTSQVLPPSFYLAAQPTTWWGTPWSVPPWPAVGPDVASGNVNSVATEPTGGHVNKIPARLCFENLVNDPAYATSSPRVKLFDAPTCYIGGSATPIATPYAAASGTLAQPGIFQMRYR